MVDKAATSGTGITHGHQFQSSSQVTVWESSGGGSNCLGSGNDMGDLEEILGSWLWTNPPLAIEPVDEDFYLLSVIYLSASPTLLSNKNKQINGHLEALVQPPSSEASDTPSRTDWSSVQIAQFTK